MNGSQGFHIQIPRACEYVILHGKKDFAHVIKWRTLGSGDYLGGP